MSLELREKLSRAIKGTGAPAKPQAPLRTFRPNPTPSEIEAAILKLPTLPHEFRVAFCQRDQAYASGPGRTWTPDEQAYAAAIDIIRSYAPHVR